MARNDASPTTSSPGLHHVTLMASDAQRNLDFHTRTLGLRLTKKTVNFDDPSLYHLYFSDRTGTPGTALTYFPIPHAAPGHTGAGETSETAFRIPAGALAFWLDRFAGLNVDHDAPQTRFGETVLPFRDPDGARMALVGVEALTTDAEAAWITDEIAAEHAIQGFHGVTLLLRDTGATASVLTTIFGYAQSAQEAGRTRFTAPSDHTTPGLYVDLVAEPGAPRGRMGAGSVHHIAFRANSDADAFAMKDELADKLGIHATEQKDRTYFRSIYFREPGGVLFEIATDEPGFLIDETEPELGTSLKLPRQYEADRARIERALPALNHQG